MTLLFSVTAPFRAKALPQLMLAPLFMVMPVSARIFPANAVVVPRVAELPTCQNTFSFLITFHSWGQIRGVRTDEDGISASRWPATCGESLNHAELH